MDQTVITDNKPQQRFNWGHISYYRTALMGFFCLYIIMFHNTIDWNHKLEWFHLFVYRGNAGVDAFLFLSGIGLYYSFQKHGEQVFPFYKKRLIRILFPYFLLCTPYYIYLSFFKHKELSFLKCITQIAFVTDNLITTWYIPCILVCYLFFPLLYYIQNKEFHFNGQKISRNIITALVVFFYFLMLVYVRDNYANLYNNIEIALTRGIIFIIGCHCAPYVQNKKQIPSGTAFASALFIYIYVFYIIEEARFSAFWTRLSYVPFSFAFVIVIAYLLYCIDTKTNKHSFPFLEFVGNHSLELYLTHVMIKDVYKWVFGSRNIIEKSGFIDYCVIIAAAFIISIGSHYIIDRLLKIKPPQKQRGHNG